jgi:recombination protein RecT
MGSVTTALANRDAAVAQASTLRDAIKRSEGQFAMALPRHVSPDRFLRSALTAINVVPRLADCTQTSILAGLMQAAQLGLEVADVRGQAYLIPRKVKGVYQASFQLGFRGMIDLAARAGITVDVDVICEGDKYDYERGTAPRLYHKPTLADRGETIAYYAVGTFSDGRPPSFVIMGRSEVEKHRDKFASSRDYNTKEITGPWVDHFDAMALKTVVRKLLNYLPTTVELRQTIVEAEAKESDIGSIDYGPITAPVGVDLATGEISADPTVAIDSASVETEEAEG